jgi:hypothetical protein
LKSEIVLLEYKLIFYGEENMKLIELLHKYAAPGFYATTDSDEEAFFLDLDYLNYEELAYYGNIEMRSECSILDSLQGQIQFNYLSKYEVCDLYSNRYFNILF